MAILERHTVVLVKLGHALEAKAAIDYIAKYKRDRSRSSFEKICARVEKGLRKALSFAHHYVRAKFPRG